MKKIKKFIILFFAVSLFGGTIPAPLSAAPLDVGGSKIERSFVVENAEYISDVIGTADPFNTIASSWNMPLAKLYLRSGETSLISADWVDITGETDIGRDEKIGAENIFGDIFYADMDRFFQYKAVFSPADIGKEFKVNFNAFDSSKQAIASSKIKTAADGAGLGPKIISRSEWGANESYMKWAPEYSEVKSFVIHHTAGEEGAKINQMDAVRGLYYGHAVSYGWGDIGYNYIIDVNGNIYEGRSGGGGVIGGHTLGYNPGTIGIVLIGDYNVRNVETAQYQSLIDFVAYKAYQYQIDPSSTVFLKDKNVPAVAGHKDLNPTLCPGTTIYERLSDLRIQSKTKLTSYPSRSYNSQLISSDSGARVYGGDTQKIRLSLKNNGNIPWPGQGSHKPSILSTDSRISARLVDFGRSVEPGEIGNLYLEITPTAINETVSMPLQTRIDGVIISGGEFSVAVNVSTPEYRAKLISKSADQMIRPGKQVSLSADFKNVGTRSWNGSEGMRLVTEDGRESAFYTSGDWEDRRSVGTLDSPSVSVGGTTKISFLATAPNTPGQYKEKFILRASNVGLEGGDLLKVEWNLVVGDNEGQIATSTVETKTYSKNPGDYDYQYVGQSASTAMLPGETKTLYVEVKNTGKTNWYKDTFRLATNAPRDRESAFANSTWTGKNRIEMSQYKIEPGQVATFSFNITAPQTYGLTKEYFNFVAEGVGWTKDIGIYFPIEVSPPVFKAELVSGSLIGNAMPGDTLSYSLKFKNTGNQVWNKDKVRLGTSSPFDRVSGFQNSSWYSPTRIQFTENIVNPGETATFDFTVNTNKANGKYQEKIKFVAEGSAWFGDEMILAINLSDGIDDFAYVGQSEHVTFTSGESRQVFLEVKNTGTKVWKRDGATAVRLATARPYDRVSGFINGNRISMDRDTVNPGEHVRFTFNITAPQTTGTQKEYFALVRDGVSWFNDIGIYWEFTVNPAQVSQPQTNTQPVVNQSGIAASVADSKKVKISSTGPFIVVNGAATKIAEGTQGDIVEAFYKDGKHYITLKGQTQEASGWIRVVPWAAQTILAIDSYTDRPAWNQSINDNKFKGVVEVRYSPVSKKLWAINELNIEDYLKGVSEPLEAGSFEYIKSAVVAERSYIYYHLSRGGRWPNDYMTLRNSRNGNGDDQIYQGYGFTSRATNIPKAVTETQGEVVTYGGNPVLTPYFTQSDGRTRSINEVWGSKQSDYPWLVGVSDPYCAGKPLLGHGVGMSGCGARAMGSAGKTYKEILGYYYTGTAVGKIDTTLNVRVGIYGVDP